MGCARGKTSAERRRLQYERQLLRSPLQNQPHRKNETRKKKCNKNNDESNTNYSHCEALCSMAFLGYHLPSGIQLLGIQLFIGKGGGFWFYFTLPFTLALAAAWETGDDPNTSRRRTFAPYMGYCALLVGWLWEFMRAVPSMMGLCAAGIRTLIGIRFL